MRRRLLNSVYFGLSVILSGAEIDIAAPSIEASEIEIFERRGALLSPTSCMSMRKEKPSKIFQNFRRQNF